MSTTWENLLHHVRTIHGHVISNELLNENRVTIAKPETNQDALDEHQLATKRRDQSYNRLSKLWKSQKEIYEEKVMQGEPTIASKAKMFLDILNNEIVEAKYKIHHTIPIVM